MISAVGTLKELRCLQYRLLDIRKAPVSGSPVLCIPKVLKVLGMIKRNCCAGSHREESAQMVFAGHNFLNIHHLFRQDVGRAFMAL